MKFSEIIKIANRNLLRNKLRTFLTITAIFIGAFTLTLTNALGDGARDFANQQVRTTEAENVLFIRKKFDLPDEARNPEEVPEYKEESAESNDKNNLEINSYLMSRAQVENAVKDIPEIKSVTPAYYPGGEWISLGEKKYQLNLGMLSEGVHKKTEAGDSINGKNQIVLSLNLAKTLNPNFQSLVGQNATIGYKLKSGEMRTMPLKIVGVSTKGVIQNNNSFIDAESAKKIYEEQNADDENFDRFQSYTLSLNQTDEQTVQKIKAKLDEKNLMAESQFDRQKSQEEGVLILQIVLNLFALIALLAASFGIVNTLIIAVMERTKEIGLQKAVGMGRKTIFSIFSMESVLIGFWGAISGIIGAMLIGTIINLILGYKYPEAFEIYRIFSFKFYSIILIMLLICFMAFIAGVFPAFRASRLNPIEALRYE